MRWLTPQSAAQDRAISQGLQILLRMAWNARSGMEEKMTVTRNELQYTEERNDVKAENRRSWGRTNGRTLGGLGLGRWRTVRQPADFDLGVGNNAVQIY